MLWEQERGWRVWKQAGLDAATKTHFRGIKDFSIKAFDLLQFIISFPALKVSKLLFNHTWCSDVVQMLLCVGGCVRLRVKLVFTGKKGIHGPTLLQRLHLQEGSCCGPHSGTTAFTGHWLTFIVFYSFMNNHRGKGEFSVNRSKESKPHLSEADPHILQQETLHVVENWVVSSLV